MAGPSFCTPGFLFLRPWSLASCTDPCLPRLLLARLSGARPARPLDGLISPQDGKASIALPQWRRRDFLPLGLPPRKRGDPGCAHSSRAKKACPREGGGLAAAILRSASALRLRLRSPAADHRPRGHDGLG